MCRHSSSRGSTGWLLGVANKFQIGTLSSLLTSALSAGDIVVLTHAVHWLPLMTSVLFLVSFYSALVLIRISEAAY